MKVPVGAAVVGCAACAACAFFLGARWQEGLRTKNDDEDDVLDGFVGLIGNTPMIELKSLSRATGCRILAKCEFLNPGGSSKDRLVAAAVQRGEDEGVLSPGMPGVLYEGTMGSTGVSLTLVALAKQYHSRIFMPSDQGDEKAELLRILGAEVVRMLPVSIIDPHHFVNEAKRQGQEDPNGYFLDQFENPVNWQCHYATTGPEIWKQTAGKLDAFVIGAGTGGTIAGVSLYLKEQSKRIKVFLADPFGSGLFNRVNNGVCFSSETQREGTRKRHQTDSIVEGVGLKRITANFARGEGCIDGAFRCTDREAVEMSRYILKKEGLFVGTSTAVNLVGAVRAARSMGEGHCIVTVICDGGHRYLSKFWNSEYLAEKGLSPTAIGLEFLDL